MPYKLLDGFALSVIDNGLTPNRRTAKLDQEKLICFNLLRHQVKKGGQKTGRLLTNVRQYGKLEIKGNV